MLLLIAVGIRRTQYGGLSELDAVARDVERVYGTLAETAVSFSHPHSACLIDVSSDEFMKVVERTKRFMDHPPPGRERSDMTLIFYFSGHGKARKGNLELYFGDYSGNDAGLTYVDEIMRRLNEIKCSCAVILDCCESGAAVDPEYPWKLPTHVPVLASSRPWEEAEKGKDGSTFTRLLCEAIRQVRDERKVVSFNSIAECVRMPEPRAFYKYLPPHMRDFVIVRQSSPLEGRSDITGRFLSKIQISDPRFREILWYALGEFPSDVKGRILQEYFGGECPPELNWFVRRAIGHTIGEISNERIRDELIDARISSELWMERAIGIVACRFNLGAEETKNRLRRTIEREARRSKPSMDVIWLANLYLAHSTDSEAAADENAKIAMSTNLAGTPWGVTEVWERYSGIYQDPSRLLEYIESCVRDKDSELLANLYLHLHFRYPSLLSANRQRKMELLPHAEGVRKSGLLVKLYGASERGLTERTIIKWLYSFLDEYWRGQIQFNYQEYLDTKGPNDRKRELSAMRDAPMVEMRMSVFEHFRSDAFGRSSDCKDYDCLAWGLEDSHPFVRKAALRVFQREGSQLEKAFAPDNRIRPDLYPSVFDFLLTGVEVGYTGMDRYIAGFERTYGFCEREKQALTWESTRLQKKKKIIRDILDL